MRDGKFIDKAFSKKMYNIFLEHYISNEVTNSDNLLHNDLNQLGKEALEEKISEMLRGNDYNLLGYAKFRNFLLRALEINALTPNELMNKFQTDELKAKEFKKGIINVINVLIINSADVCMDASKSDFLEEFKKKAAHTLLMNVHVLLFENISNGLVQLVSVFPDRRGEYKDSSKNALSLRSGDAQYESLIQK